MAKNARKETGNKSLFITVDNIKQFIFRTKQIVYNSTPSLLTVQIYTLSVSRES